eukprot:6798871-Prymnesium_polylepis.1
MALRSFGEQHLAGGSFAVVSSISPWVELTLHDSLGVTSVTTVDYNLPVANESWLRTASVGELPMLYSAGMRFDVIVSFSGIEHDGLGVYGDPMNPWADVAAMQEMWLLLKPGGLLLLGVPVGILDNVVLRAEVAGQRGVRFYGPVRLPRLLGSSFELVGRVWNGIVVRGNLSSSTTQPSLWYKQERRQRAAGHHDVQGWQHQPVLVLRKPTGAAAAAVLSPWGVASGGGAVGGGDR